MIYFAPKQLNSLPGLTAGMTYASRDNFNTSAYIKGLNFGDNTETTFPIVKRSLDVLDSEISVNSNIALAEQVHGTGVSIVSDPGFYKKVDGLITQDKELLIGVKVADCAAILLSDSINGVIAAIHAGWRGAAGGILPNALNKMKDLGADPANIVCYISPCISVKNFEIGEEVAVKFPSKFIDRTIGQKPHLNLKKYLKSQLIDAGVSLANIEIDPRCTVDDMSFYSFRRERDKAGRMLAFITRTSN